MFFSQSMLKKEDGEMLFLVPHQICKQVLVKAETTFVTFLHLHVEEITALP